MRVGATSSPEGHGLLDDLRNAARCTARGVWLVWTTDRRLGAGLGVLVLVSGLLPAGIAYLSKVIIDGVIQAAASGRPEDLRRVLLFVALEGVAILAVTGAEHGLTASRQMLRSLLNQRIHLLVLEKARQLELAQFESSAFYDRLNQLRKGAAERPVELVLRTFNVLRYGLLLASYAVLLAGFSLWIVPFLVLAALPAFATEAYFANEGFALFKWRTRPQRKREYLETVLAREDFAKEVKLFGLGDRLLQTYRDLFREIFAREKRFFARKEGWGFAFSGLALGAFYAIYAWIVYSAAAGRVSVGEMGMYLVVFREGQQALTQLLIAVGGIYDDYLYLSQLDEFVREPVSVPAGRATRGPAPGAGLSFEDVWFTYPGAAVPAVRGVSFHLRPGEKLALVGENGSGKTTLVKLLTRLYTPQRGRIRLDGLDLAGWDEGALHRRIGVIFQDFVRFQLTAGENIGVGDVAALGDRERWREAAVKGLAEPFLARLPDGYDTQLGRWFDDGQELSGGQWQKVALARLFMRRDADILVLDEPTAAMDAEAEARIYERFREMTGRQMAILISHRFSTVREADQILVLERGEILEQGSHEQMMRLGGRYSELFTLQAEGYR